MQQFVSDPATNTTDTTGAINVDYDSDNDADMDGDASGSMTDMELCDHNIDNISDCEQDTELKNWSSDIDTDTDLLTASDSEDSEFNVNLDSSMCNDSNGETGNEIDKEYFIFPITLEKADDVVEFFNTIKFLGGEKTVNFIRGPMWSGCGSGGVFNPEGAKPNLGGPGRTTRLKHSSGYTTSIDTPIVKVIAAAMENDGTALKPSTQFDEKQQGNPGGITAIAMSTLEETTIVRNGTVDCSESAHAASYLDGIVYADTGTLQIKLKIPGEESVVIAGTGKEGNLNGKADKASFAQPMGVCVELDKKIFITDAQTGSIKLITSITSIVQFLSHLGLLYKAFSVHMKHQTVPKYALS
ncbi:Hypothetical predicted protein [Paramuricea clavata]|uniref:Uncharacterized protein n=1 Tax=Paramuricea clavata TaxID=317549 RepID=A0A7D9HDH9_PARCT|nr:Hypothetical predicted protein [Paramuricea clavata]